MTPREFYRERTGARERDLELSWTMANLIGQAQAGTLKPLETLLGHRNGPRRTSREAQRQMLHFLSERYQIPLKVVH